MVRTADPTVYSLENLPGHEQWALDEGLELHAVEDVALEVDAGGDLGEGEAVGQESEDGALGDEEDGLAGFGGAGAAKSDLWERGAELGNAAFFDDGQLAVTEVDLQAAGSERAAEDDLLARCEMLMKPPTPTRRLPKRLMLTLPSRSASARPRKAASRPPPS